MSNQYGPRIVTDGLVLCLDAANRKSYPGSGTTWTDLSGNSSNFTLTNGTLFNSLNGGAMSYDGTNDSTLRSAPSTLKINGDKTLVCIHNRAISGGDGPGYLIRCGLSSDEAYGLYHGSDGNIGYQWYKGGWQTINTGSYLESPPATLGQWVHTCVTVQSTNLTFYINGISVVTATVTIPSVNPSYITIGSSNGPGGNTAQQFAGLIASVSIYNRYLSANEVEQNYNALKGRFGL